MKKEFSIMPEDLLWETERFEGSHRHECFGGANRKLSIEDGLVIFISPQMHNMGDKGIHYNKDFMDYVHKIAQQTWQDYYEKTKEDFIKRYGKSFL